MNNIVKTIEQAHREVNAQHVKHEQQVQEHLQITLQAMRGILIGMSNKGSITKEELELKLEELMS